MLRIFAALVITLGFLASVAAQPPAATGNGKPAAPVDWHKSLYPLHLVFAIEKNPALTQSYVDRIKGEVEAALGLDLGSVAMVESRDDHPFLNDVLVKGLGELDKRQVPIDDVKTHFIRIAYDNGQYLVELRQMDGNTGILSPLRRLSTPDRVWVPRMIATTIARDFGVVGTVGSVTAMTVDLKLRGLGHEDPESIRVQPGDVFAISRMQGRGKLQGGKIPNALILVTSALSGTGCQARFFGDRENVLQPARETYRVIKLGTQSAPLSLQVVDAKSRDPIIAGVKTSLGGYDRNIEELSTNNQGRVRGKELYRNVVFLELSVAGQRMRMPLPIVDDQPIVVALAGTKQLEQIEQLTHEVRKWGRHLNESSLAVKAEVAAMFELNKRDERGAAAKAEEVLNKFNEEVKVLQQKITTINEQYAGTVSNGAQSVAAMQKALDDHAKATREFLTEFIGERVNPTPAQVHKRNGRLAEQAADYNEAVKLYDESLKADGNQPELKQHVTKIKSAMASKGAKHDAARKFLLDTWGKLEADDLKKQMKQAQDAVKELIAHGDFPAMLRTITINIEQMQKLTSLYEALVGNDEDEAVEKRKLLESIYNSINEMNDKLVDGVQKARSSS